MPLTLQDLPRPEPSPAPARRWQAGRPGDLRSPGDVPWGGAFGTPGPDAGYARWLLADAGRSGDEVTALAVVVAARSSRLGRAPVAADFEAAEILLAGLPAAARRPGHGMEGMRRLLEALDPVQLAAPLEALRRDHAAGGA
jgi:hypothetical protein